MYGRDTLSRAKELICRICKTPTLGPSRPASGYIYSWRKTSIGSRCAARVAGSAEAMAAMASTQQRPRCR